MKGKKYTLRFYHFKKADENTLVHAAWEHVVSIRSRCTKSFFFSQFLVNASYANASRRAVELFASNLFSLTRRVNVLGLTWSDQFWLTVMLLLLDGDQVLYMWAYWVMELKILLTAQRRYVTFSRQMGISVSRHGSWWKSDFSFCFLQQALKFPDLFCKGENVDGNFTTWRTRICATYNPWRINFLKDHQRVKDTCTNHTKKITSTTGHRKPQHNEGLND